MSVINAILAVFTAIGEWFASVFADLEPIFWTAGTGGDTGSLTFIGALSVAGLGVAIILLVINKITDFLRFR